MNNYLTAIYEHVDNKFLKRLAYPMNIQYLCIITLPIFLNVATFERQARIDMYFLGDIYVVSFL